jgi:imidazolonepropionase-like amidohydrolase
MLRMIRTLLAATAALGLAAALPAHAETLYVRAGHLVDPEAGAVLGPRLLRVEDGRVAAVLPDGPVPKGAKLVDWSAFTVLPGLIDCHVHLADTGQTANVAEPLLHSPIEIAYIGARNARTTLMAGFTTVHDVGSFRAFADVELRDAINRGDVAGPRMQAVGAYVTVPGGGGEVTGFSPEVRVPEDMRAGVVRGADDARNDVKRDRAFSSGIVTVNREGDAQARVQGIGFTLFLRKKILRFVSKPFGMRAIMPADRSVGCPHFVVGTS